MFIISFFAAQRNRAICFGTFLSMGSEKRLIGPDFIKNWRNCGEVPPGSVFLILACVDCCVFHFPLFRTTHCVPARIVSAEFVAQFSFYLRADGKVEDVRP